MIWHLSLSRPGGNHYPIIIHNSKNRHLARFPLGWIFFQPTVIQHRHPVFYILEVLCKRELPLFFCLMATLMHAGTILLCSLVRQESNPRVIQLLKPALLQLCSLYIYFRIRITNIKKRLHYVCKTIISPRIKHLGFTMYITKFTALNYTKCRTLQNAISPAHQENVLCHTMWNTVSTMLQRGDFPNIVHPQNSKNLFFVYVICNITYMLIIFI